MISKHDAAIAIANKLTGSQWGFTLIHQRLQGNRCFRNCFRVPQNSMLTFNDAFIPVEFNLSINSLVVIPDSVENAIASWIFSTALFSTGFVRIPPCNSCRSLFIRRFCPVLGAVERSGGVVSLKN
ncbi:hypothetical protein OGM63_12615 [Plectonema radiosum NIES-515]|uniref:Uncharacterized protein n=1 Tax=Plectonema radiosum NIES-515 TaxID=2986073 RepID=A0ABT3AYY6_9CYAN|nr:hypothetical protein [Plectonema radiosum]MCV3214343.1 hypothetical protein [Plectonema radiosum NIES-515]